MRMSGISMLSATPPIKARPIPNLGFVNSSVRATALSICAPKHPPQNGAQVRQEPCAIHLIISIAGKTHNTPLNMKNSMCAYQGAVANVAEATATATSA